MANRFQRNAIPNGDLNAWATPESSQNNRALGNNTCVLYDDAGTLKLTKGQIGFDSGLTNGTGTFQLDTIETISLVGASLSTWHKIEINNSASAAIISITAITGANNSESLPSEFTDSFDSEKGGFYITTTKRVLGIAWVNFSGVLKGIINCGSLENSYVGYCESDDTAAMPYIFQIVQGSVLQSGDTNYRKPFFLHVVDEKGAGVDGGSFSATAPNTFLARDLNTVKFNNIFGSTIAANTVTLPAGNYYAEWWAVAHKVNNHKTGIEIASVAVAYGNNSYSGAGVSDQNISAGSHRFSLSAPTGVQVVHSCQTTRATDGFGLSILGGTPGAVNRYCELKVWRL